VSSECAPFALFVRHGIINFVHIRRPGTEGWDKTVNSVHGENCQQRWSLFSHPRVLPPNPACFSHYWHFRHKGGI